MSLRRRLLALLLGLLTLGWGAATVTTYVDTHGEVDRLLDAHLAQTTAIIAAQAGHELLELEPGDLVEPGPYGQGVTFQVWEDGERLIVKSADAPGERLSRIERGFADTDVAGRQWRVFTTWDAAHEALIEVAEDHAVRDRIARQVALNALVPLAVALPVLALLLWWGVGRVLQPLAGLGEQVRRRDAQALAPLEPGSAPQEALPLVERLNELFARIRRSAELERRFTADAAHELRKPVAAVRAQAEVARTTPDAGTRDAALDRVVQACDRMATLVEQLLTLARVDQDGAARPGGTQDLAGIARQAVAEMAPAALAEAGVAVALEAPGAVPVQGQADLLGIVVRNLAWNAVRHGGSGVQVAVTTTPAGAVLAVTDTGPGVPAGELPRLGERFHRGAATGAGSGLGLSIVRRIAELHGARVTFGPGPGGRGFEARVSFPA